VLDKTRYAATSVQCNPVAMHFKSINRQPRSPAQIGTSNSNYYKVIRP